MKSHLKLVLRAVVSISLIFFLFKTVSVSNVISNLKTASPVFLLVFVFYFMNYFSSAFRWRELIIYKTKNKITILYLLKLYYIGSFLSNFMPSTIGGDVYKAYKLGKDTGELSKSIAATFMERLVGVVSLSLISSVALVVIWGFKGMLVFLVFWFLIMLGFASLNILSKFIKIFRKFSDSLNLYRNNKKAVFKAFLYSIPVQAGSVLTHFFTSIALGINIPVSFAFFAFPVIGFLSFLPISISGLGVQDNIYVFFYQRIGISASLAASASVFYHILRAINSLIGWFLLTFDKEFKGSLTLDFSKK